MSLTGLQVRRGRGSDLDAVLELERGCATAPQWGVGAYSEIVAGQGVPRCLFVAEIGSGVVGFAVGAVQVDGVGELESVVVSASARRAGIGRELCDAVIGWCRTEGAEVVGLEVRAGSMGAIALYEGLGFVEVGRRPGYYREPDEGAVVMRLQLQ